MTAFGFQPFLCNFWTLFVCRQTNSVNCNFWFWKVDWMIQYKNRIFRERSMKSRKWSLNLVHVCFNISRNQWIPEWSDQRIPIKRSFELEKKEVEKKEGKWWLCHSYAKSWALNLVVLLLKFTNSFLNWFKHSFTFTQKVERWI